MTAARKQSLYLWLAVAGTLFGPGLADWLLALMGV